MKKPVCPHCHHPISYRAAFKGQWNWLQETTCPHCKMTVYPSLRYRKKSSVLVLFMIPVIFSLPTTLVLMFFPFSLLVIWFLSPLSLSYSKTYEHPF